MEHRASTTAPQRPFCWVRTILPQVCEYCGEVIPRNTMFMLFTGIPKRVACLHCGTDLMDLMVEGAA